MTADDLLTALSAAHSWDERIALIRRIPEEFGTAHQSSVYSEVAKSLYIPMLAPDFGYVHWKPDHELATVQSAYDRAVRLTENFTLVDPPSLEEAIRADSRVLLVFRLLLGLTAQEFGASTRPFADSLAVRPLGAARVRSLESGATAKDHEARVCALVVDAAFAGRLFPSSTGELRSKLQKPDTKEGWETVRLLASQGVPFPMFLHQRHYGGAFRQILDATSTKRGNLLEDAVESLFRDHRVPHIRVGPQDQPKLRTRFGIQIRPGPDFVVFDLADNLVALLECKQANDGGTARDKASRFAALQTESKRLGGVPVFAVLAGLGWTRTGDALGPVVKATDGRVFTLGSMKEMVSVHPFPSVINTTG